MLTPDEAICDRYSLVRGVRDRRVRGARMARACPRLDNEAERQRLQLRRIVYRAVLSCARTVARDRHRGVGAARLGTGRDRSTGPTALDRRFRGSFSRGDDLTIDEMILTRKWVRAGCLIQMAPPLSDIPPGTVGEVIDVTCRMDDGSKVVRYLVGEAGFEPATT